MQQEFDIGLMPCKNYYFGTVLGTFNGGISTAAWIYLKNVGL